MFHDEASTHDIDLSSLPETNELIHFLDNYCQLEKEYLSGMNILFMKHENLRQKNKCPSLFRFFYSITELKQKYIDEFSSSVLNAFKEDLSEQAKQVSLIMQDLNYSNKEIEERKDAVSKLVCSFKNCSVNGAIRQTDEFSHAGTTKYTELTGQAERDIRIQLGNFGKRRAAQITLLSKANQILSTLRENRIRLVKELYEGIVNVESSLIDSIFKILPFSITSPSIQNEYLLDIDKCTSPFTVPEMVAIIHPTYGELKYLCFGVHLIDFVSWRGELLPFLLQNCFKLLDKKGIIKDYIQADPSSTELLSLSLKVESDGELEAPNMVAGLVLKFFADLPEPLFPFITHQELDAIALRPQEDIRLGLITKTIKNLPNEHFYVLSKFIEHLYNFWRGQEPVGQDLISISSIVGNVIIRKDYLTFGSVSTVVPKVLDTELVITKDLITNYPLMFGNFSER